MSVIDCFAEDVDFPGTGIVVSTSTQFFRPGFARCGVQAGGYAAWRFSRTFAAVSSCWLSFQLYGVNGNFSEPLFGIGSSAANSGLMIGCNGGGSLCLWLLNNGAITALEQTGSINGLQRYDLQFIALNTATYTVNVYQNGVLVFSYTGSGVLPFSTVDSLVLGRTDDVGHVSEIIVADESTLGWQGLKTASPNGNGTTQQWSNPDFSNINPITINDGNSSYTDVVGQDQQVTLLPEPAGNYAIKAVTVVARANGPAGSVPTGLQLGFNNGTTVAVGTSHAITTDFEPYSDTFETDPTTGQPWASLTGYQLDLRSA